MTSEEFRTNPLFLRNQLEGEGIFELPVIRKEEMSLANIELIGYDNLYRGETQKGVHFFLDDYKFEALWNQPDPKIERLREYRAVLSPQFSVYTEMPLPLQLYNIFRSRWCGAYLQRQGVKVIPTVYWGKPASFWFCFDGIEPGSVVAVSTVGVRTETPLFLQGYTEMMKRLRPKAVICYGKPFEEMDGKIIEIDYAKTNRLAAETPSASAKEEKGLGYGHSPILVFKQGHVASAWEEKGMGTAGIPIPDFPGWDPTVPPGKNYEWRGKGDPLSGHGNWYNPNTGEWMHADLNHGEPIGPHWDYFHPNGAEDGYRIFEDGFYEEKIYLLEREGSLC